MIFLKKPSTVANNLDAPSTIIGKGVYLESARMTGTESIRIDGIFKGNIEIDGSLVLGDCGSITGDIRANYFIVAGEVNGNIACETQLHFASSCKVIGDVQAGSLVVDEGAQVSGRFIISGMRKSTTHIGSTYGDTKKISGDYDD